VVSSSGTGGFGSGGVNVTGDGGVRTVRVPAAPPFCVPSPPAVYRRPVTITRPSRRQGQAVRRIARGVMSFLIFAAATIWRNGLSRHDAVTKPPVSAGKSKSPEAA
jgi:hypothetical protein